MAKLFKLLPTSCILSEYDVMFNPADLPDASVNSILEIYHPDALQSRLLVQARALRDDVQQPKDSISLSSNIVKMFSLKVQKDVCVRVVSPSDIAITLVEVTYKEQYWGRADMWDIRKLLLGSCIYRGQRIQCFQSQYAVVDELWSEGERVTCGCVVADTLFAFRSLTAQVNIFIQMSAEMWSFDRYGYLHFEKTVAFLEDLFRLWTEKNCNHDLTLTLFSRSFYDARLLEEFPEPMRECVRTDCRGRFYEDFYHVVIQNERCDDWTKSPILNVLRSLFDQYEKSVVFYHEDGFRDPIDGQEGRPWKVSAARGIRPPSRDTITSSSSTSSIPLAWNSTAAEGNVLEVLNMGLNVFEKYYVDRSFDRTGKFSVVLTPGAGVFEVDRSLANITRQRTIDCGSSSMLVCMAEHPEHAVPLFIYTRNDACTSNDYNIPHWINYCYYTHHEQLDTHVLGNFAPWCDVPLNLKAHASIPADDIIIPPFHPDDGRLPVDYDEYDEQIFRPPVTHVRALQNRKKVGVRRRRRCPRLTPNAVETIIEHCSSCNRSADQRVLSKIYMCSSYGGSETEAEKDWIIGSVGTPAAHCRRDPVIGLPLINPFSPQRLQFRVTANQRRWSHAFMTSGRTSATKQSQSNQPGRRRVDGGSGNGSGTSPVTPKDSMLLGSELRARYARRSTGRRISESSDASGCQLRWTVAGSPLEYRETGVPMRISTTVIRRTDSACSITNVGTIVGSLSSSFGGYFLNGIHRSRYSTCESDAGPLAWAWGSSGGDRELSAKPQSSMDWKSLAYPLSLPLTTDFFPDRRSLENDYVTSEYTLLPEDMFADIATSPDREKITATLVYNQMVLQRLAQNFQIVLPSKLPLTKTATTSASSIGIPSRPASSRKLTGETGSPSEETVLSVGRIFHILTLSEPEIRVKSYSPRHPFPRTSHNYSYRFRVPDSPAGFDTSCTQFTCEPLELYRWNYVDQYVSTRGADRTFRLQESLKYWRSRFCLIHLDVSGSKRLQSGASTNERCDVFAFRNQYNHVMLIEGLMRFLETENKLKRVSSNSFSRRDSLMNLVYFAAIRDPLSIFFNAVVDNNSKFLPSGSAADVMRNPMADKSTENSEEPVLPESLASLPEIDPAELEERITRAVREVEFGSEAWIQWRISKWDPKRARKWLSVKSDRSEVVQSLTDPVEGPSFVQTQPGSGCHQLPEGCFISAEAALWAIRAVEGVDTLVMAIEYMQQLVSDGCIRHASGNKNLPFIYGFYLYFVITGDRRCDSNKVLPLGYTVNDDFEWEWCEVAISENTCRTMPACLEMFAEGPPPNTPSETSSNQPGCRHKEVSVDVDPGRASGREVWATAHYHATFNPDTAFELTVEWLAATGPILGDLIQMWSRKASNNGLHMLPVPRDPFVLPDMSNADPLRGPIFVPLNLACLRDDSDRDPFHEFPEATRSRRLLLLQFSILDLFGFIRDRPPTPGCVAGVGPGEWPQFIHCTGGMLVSVPQLDGLEADNSANGDKLLYRQYIIRQCRFLGLGDVSERLPAGFLWAWNFMLNKRWRNMVTGDEMLQDRMLSDLRRFCDGGDGRLRAHWRRARTLSDAYKKFEQLRTGSGDGERVNSNA